MVRDHDQGRRTHAVNSVPYIIVEKDDLLGNAGITMQVLEYWSPSRRHLQNAFALTSHHTSRLSLDRS